MLNDNKVCILCNTHYKYCEGCPSKYNVNETWRNIFCSEECRDIYSIYDSLKANKTTDAEAGKMLRKYDASYIERTKEPMKAMLLVAYNDKPKAASKAVEKSIEKPVEKKEAVKKTTSDSTPVAPKKKTRKKKDIEVN